MHEDYYNFIKRSHRSNDQVRPVLAKIDNYVPVNAFLRINSQKSERSLLQLKETEGGFRRPKIKLNTYLQKQNKGNAIKFGASHSEKKHMALDHTQSQLRFDDKDHKPNRQRNAIDSLFQFSLADYQIQQCKQSDVSGWEQDTKNIKFIRRGTVKIQRLYDNENTTKSKDKDRLRSAVIKGIKNRQNVSRKSRYQDVRLLSNLLGRSAIVHF